MTLADLIARVEGLTGPSAEVDAEVAVLCDRYRLKQSKATGKWAVFAAPFEPGKWASASGCSSRDDAIRSLSSFLSLPRYTASIDAVVALIERELPGYGHGYLPLFYKEKPFAGVIGADGASIDLLTATIVGGETPALALLSTFLRALDAIANGGKT